MARMTDGMRSTAAASALACDVELYAKALSCHDADICKARDTGDKYFVGLVGDSHDQLPRIREALEKISKYS